MNQTNCKLFNKSSFDSHLSLHREWPPSWAATIAAAFVVEPCFDGRLNRPKSEEASQKISAKMKKVVYRQKCL